MTEYVKPQEGYTVYTKTNCRGCEKVKKLLPDAHYVNCDEYLEDVDGFLDFIETITEKGPTKFPMVFLNKDYIGGCDSIFTTNDNF